MNGRRDFQPVLGIPIENEEARSGIKRERLPQLLNNPKARGMPRDVAVQNTPAIVADDKEAVEHGEGDRGNREEIHRRNSLLVITKKGEPPLGWVRGSGSPFHPAGNRSLGNIKTKHEKFSVDTGSTPARVLGSHLEDEVPDLFRRRSSTHGLSNSRNHAPVPTESSAVPSDNGFGCDDEECLFPV